MFAAAVEIIRHKAGQLIDSVILSFSFLSCVSLVSGIKSSISVFWLCLFVTVDE
jgi:hypothetical protein